MKILFALVLLLIYTTNASFLRSLLEEWVEFKVNHSKNYETKYEEKFRFMVYLHNRHKIAKHNALYQQGLATFELGMNQFGDWTDEEYSERMNCFNSTTPWHLFTDEGASYVKPANVVIPKSVDWRQHGAVTPVKIQGGCDACWAFSATGALEGQHFRRTGKLVSLSEQNLVDCSRRFGNKGCQGGAMHHAFVYIKENHGIDTEQSYPYEAKEGTCRYKPGNKGADDAGFVAIKRGNELQLQSAVANAGPVSVAVDGSSHSFRFYKGGIFSDPTCLKPKINLSMLVVGYGSEQGQDYWLLKSSLGTKWGEKGYMRMPRNKHNYCGIANYASYPLVK